MSTQEGGVPKPELVQAGNLFADVLERIQGKCRPCPGGCGDEYVLADGEKCLACNTRDSEAEQFQKDTELKSDRTGRQIKEWFGEEGFERFWFKTYIPKTVTMATACELMEAFDPNLHNYFLAGTTGVGKTHLVGAALRNHFVRTDAMFVKAPQLRRMFRKCQDVEAEEALLVKLADVPILAIDDVGLGRDTEYSNQILFEIIDARMSNRKKGLLVTSNLGMSKIAEQMGDDRMTSRLNSMCRRLYIEGPDHRDSPEAKT